MFKKYKETSNQSDLLNAMQFSINLEQKCNYWATLEGVALGHHLREWVKHRDGSGFGKIIAGFYLVIEIVINLVDDVLGLALAF